MFNVFLHPHVHRRPSIWEKICLWICLTLLECNSILIRAQGQTSVRSAAVKRPLHSLVFIQLSLQHTTHLHSEGEMLPIIGQTANRSNHVPLSNFLHLYSQFWEKAHIWCQRTGSLRAKAFKGKKRFVPRKCCKFPRQMSHTRPAVLLFLAARALNNTLALLMGIRINKSGHCIELSVHYIWIKCTLHLAALAALMVNGHISSLQLLATRGSVQMHFESLDLKVIQWKVIDN